MGLEPEVPALCDPSRSHALSEHQCPHLLTEGNGHPSLARALVKLKCNNDCENACGVKMQTAGDWGHYLIDVRGTICSERYMQLTRARSTAEESETQGLV